MKFKELIAAAEATVIDEAKIKAMKARQEAADKKFEKQARAAVATKEFLSRTYTI